MSSFNLNTIDFYTDEVFVLSIETTKKIDNENDNLGLMHFSQDNDKFVYVFKSKNYCRNNKGDKIIWDKTIIIKERKINLRKKNCH